MYGSRLAGAGGSRLHRGRSIRLCWGLTGRQSPDHKGSVKPSMGVRQAAGGRWSLWISV